jgi:hypothetical protein
LSTVIDPRYPIGRFQWEQVDGSRVEELIGEIEALPKQLRAAYESLSQPEVDTPYREGGWTPRHLVHHMADSHMNAYIRHRLALTEDVPTIKPYKEALWAQLPDVRTTDPEVSLVLVEELHRRWVDTLRGVPPEALGRTFHHPEQGRDFTIRDTLALYAWHGRHHVAHIKSVMKPSTGGPG